MPLAPITITDPQAVPTYPDGPLSRWCQRALHDPRDEVLVRHSLRALAIQIAAMALLYAALQRPGLPAFVPIIAYLALWGWATPPVILLLHCTMHRKFIKQPKWLDKAHPFVMSFFFGMPMGFREHHIGMHQVEDNMGEDLSSTIAYRRDSFLHFLHYFGRFFFLTPVELPLYLARNRRTGMARRVILGELAQLSIAGGSLVVFDWRFGFTAFLAPVVLTRFMMMVGNWGQHAFINTARRNGGLANSITCINCGYNRSNYNDGYHVGHHLSAKRHWTELPADFLANRELYAREGALVFEGLDFFLVSLLLWLGQWKILAKRFVRLDGPRSDEEVIAMLKSRVHPVRSWPAEEADSASAAA